MNYPIIWFDLDNTLLDFGASSVIAFKELLKEIGLEQNEDHYALFHEVNKLAWKEFEQEKITQDELKKVRFQRFFDELGFDFDGLSANTIYLNKIVEYPHFVPSAVEILDHCLENKYEVSIITNGMKEVQRPRINKLNWGKYFKHIFVSDELGVAKPNHAFFQHCYEQSGEPPKGDILVVGDSLDSDILGANRFGLDSVWHNYDNKYCPPDIVPTHEITKMISLKEIM